jgi:hypothetical protein
MRGLQKEKQYNKENKRPNGRTQFRNRVLRGIFGHMTDEVPGGWRKLHEELH